MRNMMDRAMHHMEKDISREYSMTELRQAVGIAMRSQYALSMQLLESGMVVRSGGKYRIADHLVRAHLGLDVPLDAAGEKLINDLLAPNYEPTSDRDYDWTNG